MSNVKKQTPNPSKKYTLEELVQIYNQLQAEDGYSPITKEDVVKWNNDGAAFTFIKTKDWSMHLRYSSSSAEYKWGFSSIPT